MDWMFDGEMDLMLDGVSEIEWMMESDWVELMVATTLQLDLRQLLRSVVQHCSSSLN